MTKHTITLVKHIGDISVQTLLVGVFDDYEQLEKTRYELSQTFIDNGTFINSYFTIDDENKELIWHHTYIEIR